MPAVILSLQQLCRTSDGCEGLPAGLCGGETTGVEEGQNWSKI